MKNLLLLSLLFVCVVAFASVSYTSYSIGTIANADPHYSNLATHVQTSGYIISKAKQTDGDYHITVCDSKSFTSFSKFHCVNAETVPYLQCNPLPANGTFVTIKGTLRFDLQQDWWELHPAEYISGTTCYAMGKPAL
jgi:hypothetical protein